MKTEFHDRHGHIANLKACETAQRILCAGRAGIEPHFIVTRGLDPRVSRDRRVKPGGHELKAVQACPKSLGDWRPS